MVFRISFTFFEKAYGCVPVAEFGSKYRSAQRGKGPIQEIEEAVHSVNINEGSWLSVSYCGICGFYIFVGKLL